MEDQILKWIADYCNGNISGEDFTDLQVWLKKNTENRIFFEKQTALFHDVRTLYFLENHTNHQTWKKIRFRFTKRYKIRSLFLKWSVAASLILLVGSIVYFITYHEDNLNSLGYTGTVLPGYAKAVLLMADGEKVNLGPGYVQEFKEKDGTRLHTTKENVLVYNTVQHQERQIFHTIAVPVGGEYSLQLADGSRVWLNSATTMRYPIAFTGDNREVYVEGEAFFEVMKDARHPFVVHAGGAEVKVLGTEFNISAYPEDAELVTTLKSGKVEMSCGKSKVELLPGHQAVWQREESSVFTREVDASLYTAWLRGVFEFENLSLERIGVQFSRWYGVEFVYTDPGLADRYFTGGVKKYNTLRESLDLIEITTNVHFEIVNTKVFVTSR